MTLNTQADYLRGAAEAARAGSVRPRIEKGFKGQELGEAFKVERLDALKVYRAQYSS